MSISKLSAQIQMHAHPPGCAIGLVATSKKCQILLLHASPVSTCCIIAQIRMQGYTPGSSTVLLITKKIHSVTDQKFSPVSI